MAASALAADLGALGASLVLVGVAPASGALAHWPGGARSGVESASAGVNLAYVLLDLLVELARAAGPAVHGRLPLGPGPMESLFAVVLAGAAWWYAVAAIASRVGGGRLRYRAQVVPQFVYGMFIGGALTLEAEHGAPALVLFTAAMFVHLSIAQAHLRRECAEHHGSLRPVGLAVAPLLGAAGWVLLELPLDFLYLALALVAGSTIVQIVHAELPSPEAVRLAPFLLGVVGYAVLVGIRWAV